MSHPKYLADGLTWTRLALVVPILASGLTRHWGLAALLVAISILTDILDGPCARHWPYTAEENATKWWRKDAHAFDNAGDGLTFYAALFVLVVHSRFWMIAALANVVVSAALMLTIAQLKRNRPRMAEIIDVVYGWFYGVSFGAIILGLVYYWRPGYTLGFGLALAIAGIGIVALKWDRATTRPETNPERYAATV